MKYEKIIEYENNVAVNMRQRKFRENKNDTWENIPDEWKISALSKIEMIPASRKTKREFRKREKEGRDEPFLIFIKGNKETVTCYKCHDLFWVRELEKNEAEDFRVPLICSDCRNYEGRMFKEAEDE